MKIQVRNKHSKIIIQIGIAGICFFTALFTLFSLLTPSLKSEDAEKRVRLLLQRELSQKHMSILKASGKPLPGREMARQWEKEIQDINRLKFSSIGINRLLPDILFSGNSPSWIVRVSVLDDNQRPRYRYFWLGCNGIDRETSRIVWLFAI